MYIHAARVFSALAEMRADAPQGGFGTRFRGRGPRWDAVRRLYDLACRKHGLNAEGVVRTAAPRESVPRHVQGELFPDGGPA